jgi:hypothetical protein
MTRNKGLFEDLDASVKAQIKLCNDNIVKVMGKGAINVITNSGKKTIPDVYFVPGLKHNLISVGQLTQKGEFLGGITKVGYTFVTIWSPKFRKTFFRPN